MKLLILHFVYGIFVSFIGIYVGKILERKKMFFESFMKQSNEWDKLMRDFPHRCEFRCDMCHIERINEKISVMKYRDKDHICILNIKYCNDNPSCVNQASTLKLYYGEEVYKI